MTKEWPVRIEKVYEALSYLKANNVCYTDITINRSDDILQSLKDWMLNHTNIDYHTAIQNINSLPSSTSTDESI